MSEPEVELRAAWQHLVASQPDVPLDHLIDALLVRHREPHRRYHTATHVMWVLRHVDELWAARIAPLADIEAIRLAALCHDAVYDPRRTDNEAVSADLGATIAGEIGWPAARAATVHRLVLATARHRADADDEAILIDADLAILGSQPKDYSAYVTGIRAEYEHVTEPDWRIGRTAVLQRFLEAPSVFHTERMRSAREARARANMTAELAGLR